MNLTLVLAILATCSKFSYGAIYILRIYTDPDINKKSYVETTVWAGQNLETNKKLLVLTKNLKREANSDLKATLQTLKAPLTGYVRPVLEIYTKPWLIVNGLSKIENCEQELYYDRIEGEVDEELYLQPAIALVDLKKDFWLAVQPLGDMDTKPYIWHQWVQVATDIGFSAVCSWTCSWSFTLVQSLWPEHVWKKSEIRGEKMNYEQFCELTTKQKGYALFIWTGNPEEVTDSIFEGENWVRMHIVNQIQLECYGVHFDVNIGARKVRIKFVWTVKGKTKNKKRDAIIDETKNVISIQKSKSCDFENKFKNDEVNMKYSYGPNHGYEGGYRKVIISDACEEDGYVKATYSTW